MKIKIVFLSCSFFQKSRAVPASNQQQSQTSSRQNDGYKPDGYKPDGYKPDGYKPDGYQPDGYKTDNYPTDGYVTRPDQSLHRRHDSEPVHQLPVHHYRSPSDDNYKRDHTPPGKYATR